MRSATVALALVPVLCNAACNRPGPAASVAREVTIVAADYTFTAPDTIPAGRTTLRLVNTGKELHHAVLIRIGEGRTMDDFLTALRASLSGTGAPPAWITFAGGPNATYGADTSNVTTILEPGLYALVCVIPSPDGTPHLARGMTRPLVVAPAPDALVSEPTADVNITLNDYAFAAQAPWTAGRHTVRVDNAGTQWHEIQVAQLAPGKTIADFLAWEAGGAKTPPPVAHWMGGVAALAAGGHQFFDLNLTPGTYVLICFLPDVKDGKPHFVHGMIQEITVS